MRLAVLERRLERYVRECRYTLGEEGLSQLLPVLENTHFKNRMCEPPALFQLIVPALEFFGASESLFCPQAFTKFTSLLSEKVSTLSHIAT